MVSTFKNQRGFIVCVVEETMTGVEGEASQDSWQGNWPQGDWNQGNGDFNKVGIFSQFWNDLSYLFLTKELLEQ